MSPEGATEQTCCSAAGAILSPLQGSGSNLIVSGGLRPRPNTVAPFGAFKIGQFEFLLLTSYFLLPTSYF